MCMPNLMGIGLLLLDSVSMWWDWPTTKWVIIGHCKIVFVQFTLLCGTFRVMDTKVFCKANGCYTPRPLNNNKLNIPMLRLTFMNSTLDSHGWLSLKSIRKFSSMGSIWASYNDKNYFNIISLTLTYLSDIHFSFIGGHEFLSNIPQTRGTYLNKMKFWIKFLL